LLLVWNEMSTELEGLKFTVWKKGFFIVRYPPPPPKTSLVQFWFDVSTTELINLMRTQIIFTLPAWVEFWLQCLTEFEAY
jgi:hypothetical protein